MARYVNVLTGKTVNLAHEPAGEAWQRRPDAALAKKILREERGTKTPKKNDEGAK